MITDRMPPSRSDAERLTAALEATESALRAVLAAEAQRSVDATVRRLEAQAGPFRLKDVQVEVVIKHASLEARRNRTSVPGPRASRGRPAGHIRTALLEAFTERAELATGELREHLSRLGLEPSSDNLHQHLGRLVRAGALERAGRGVYRLAT
jgi:hypothetical protein